jgi:hypothetical protein
MPKLNPAIIALAAVVLTALNIYAANATAADAFHLWLKCKAIELYINTTGANFTLPQCELTRYNYTFLVGRSGVRPLPMIGVGEFKKLNATDPKALFEQLKAIRLAALANLTRHLNKTMERLYRDLNDTDLVNASAKLGRGLDVAKKIRDVMRRSGAAPPAWLERHIKTLNETREAINALLNVTDIDKAEAALNRLMERLQNPPTPAKAAIAKQIEKLREVIDQAKTAGPEARRQIIEEIRRGNLEKARQRAEEARGKRNK